MYYKKLKKIIYLKQLKRALAAALVMGIFPVYAEQISTNSLSAVYQKAYNSQSITTVAEDDAISSKTTLLPQFEAKKTASAASSKTHTIIAEPRMFNPAIVYVEPGDVVGWTGMVSHNTVSVEGLIPDGAKHWRSKLGENLKLKLPVPGIYAYVCEPHLGFGMVGVIVVGKVAEAELNSVIQYARDNLKGPYRRLIGKLIKVKPSN